MFPLSCTPCAVHIHSKHVSHPKVTGDCEAKTLKEACLASAVAPVPLEVAPVHWHEARLAQSLAFLAAQDRVVP